MMVDRVWQQFREFSESCVTSTDLCPEDTAWVKHKHSRAAAARVRVKGSATSTFLNPARKPSASKFVLFLSFLVLLGLSNIKKAFGWDSEGIDSEALH